MAQRIRDLGRKAITLKVDVGGCWLGSWLMGCDAGLPAGLTGRDVGRPVLGQLCASCPAAAVQRLRQCACSPGPGQRAA